MSSVLTERMGFFKVWGFNTSNECCPEWSASRVCFLFFYGKLEDGNIAPSNLEEDDHMQPFCKTSKSKKGMRRAHHAVTGANITRCPKCSQSKLPHRICANCGYVNKSISLAVEETAAE